MVLWATYAFNIKETEISVVAKNLEDAKYKAEEKYKSLKYKENLK